MIFRLLLLFLIVWFLFWILKKQFLDNDSADSETKTEEVEDMVACSYCGTHVPKSLSFQSSDKFYCSQQHAELGHSSNNDSN